MTLTLPALSLALLQLPLPEGPIGQALIAVVAIGIVCWWFYVPLLGVSGVDDRRTE